MPHHTIEQCSGLPSPSAIITAPFYHSAQLPLMLTGKAESAQIRRRKRKVYVTLVYLLLFAVALLCCKIFLHWSAPRYVLLTFTDNTCLLDVSLHRIIISIHFPLIYAIWWTLLRNHTSVCMDDRDASFPLPHKLKCVWRINEDINTRRTSPERVTLWVLHHFIWVTLSSYHVLTEM